MTHWLLLDKAFIFLFLFLIKQCRTAGDHWRMIFIGSVCIPVKYFLSILFLYLKYEDK